MHRYLIKSPLVYLNIISEMIAVFVSQKVRVVVIEGIKEPIILVSTDLRLAMVQIIEISCQIFLYLCGGRLFAAMSKSAKV